MIMKKLFMFCLLFLAVHTMKAQELEWNNNIKKAIEQSKKVNKPMMLFFTGSDWCGWCMRLQNEVFKKPEFINWAKKNVVLVELDFPKRTALAPEIQQQNNELQQFFEIAGFPTVWFINANKVEDKISIEKLGSTGYVAGGPESWLGVANGILKIK